MARKQITKRSGAPQIKSPYKRCEKKKQHSTVRKPGLPRARSPEITFWHRDGLSGLCTGPLSARPLVAHLLTKMDEFQWCGSTWRKPRGDGRGKKTSKPAPKCFVLISMVSRNWSSRLALKPASNFVSSYNFLFLQVSIPLKLRGLHRRPAERQRARTKTKLEASRLALRPSLCASCGLRF